VDLGYEGDEAGGFVSGDPPLLRELVANLIDNALRYGGDAGRVTVSASAGERVVLAVEDNGPGIPTQWRERVFERFIRLPGSHGEGCGLGLAIVKEIALLHGGTASIDDGAGGRGIRISASFPARKRERKAA
jgi:two-component system, OmpR family, sensor histidine kinase TctE